MYDTNDSYNRSAPKQAFQISAKASFKVDSISHRVGLPTFIEDACLSQYFQLKIGRDLFIRSDFLNVDIEARISKNL